MHATRIENDCHPRAPETFALAHTFCPLPETGRRRRKLASDADQTFLTREADLKEMRRAHDVMYAMYAILFRRCYYRGVEEEGAAAVRDGIAA